jgi:beta-glucanase (GH16 family)
MASISRGAEGPPAAPAGYRWQVIAALSDEFDGDKLNADKWVPYHHYWKGRQPSRFNPNNVLVKDGTLQLRSTPRVESVDDVNNPEKDVWVNSACISSREGSASYGYYEARIRASRLCMTSSFWFQGRYSEIDVVEQLGDPLRHPEKKNLMLMNTHYFAEGWKNDVATPRQWQMPAASADAYHTYGVWWKDKDTIWFYHDGQKVAEVKPGGAFEEPMYLFFDTEVFTWDGLPTIASLRDPARNTMYVDWVRAWRLIETP